MIDHNLIRKIAGEKLEGSELFLVDVQVKPGNRISIFLDGDRDVTIEDCAAVSRHVENLLPENENVELTVSSCGADHPLKFPRQYIKNTGRSLKIMLADANEITGALAEVRPDGIVIHPEKKKKKKNGPEMPGSLFIPFEEIKNAKVILSFNKK